MHADISTGLHRQSEWTLKSPFSALIGKADDGRTKVDFIGYGDHYVPAETDGTGEDEERWKENDDGAKAEDAKRLV